MSRRAYIGLGANLGEPALQVQQALQHMQSLGSVIAVSPLYRSVPMGPSDQPDYCNAACVLDSALAPMALLESLLSIERACGRIRDGQRWGPRRLDLDLLHVEGFSCDVPGLTLPHPGIAQRNWVLWPLADIAPLLVVPGVGRIDTAAAAIGREGLAPWQHG